MLSHEEQVLAQEAAARWRKRAATRNRQVGAADRGEYTKADTVNRLKRRMERLQALVAARMHRGGATDEGAQEAISVPALTAGDVTDEAMERVIGETRDFLSIEYFERGLQAAACVGRIMTNGAVNGTGFLVAPDVLITNWHVLKTPAMAEDSYFELDYEANTFGPPKVAQSFDLDPAGFFMNDKPHDFALCAVKSVSQNGKVLANYGHVALIAEEGKITIGEPVNIIQHPKGRFKQIAIRNSRLLDLFEGAADTRFFHYDADTEKGSSGCPVFNDQWEVVALHHQAVPKTNTRGELVDDKGVVLREDEEDRIVWIGNEGIRTSRLVKTVGELAITDSKQEQRRKDLLALWLAESAPGAVSAPTESARPGPPAQLPPVPPERPPARPGTPQRAESAPVRREVATTTASIVLPLRIDISIGGPAGDGTAAIVSASDLMESARPDPGDPDYRHRPGYVRDFLGFEAPLPRLVDARHGPLLKVGADPSGELRYHHFSVLMNARRRLAYVAAGNLDASAPFQHKREKGSENWFFDPRIQQRQQAGGVYYASNPLDRGHLVRRDDTAWGMDEAEAKLANDDTFHWTNCSPQHEIFNQSSLAKSRGLKLWGTLENAVSALAPSYGSRLCVFNGPIFDDNDKPYGQDFFIPAAFWKVILVKGDGGEPHALAFMLSQAEQLGTLVTEGFAPEELADFVTAQVPITRLTALTGLDFGALAIWDPLRSASGPAAPESNLGARSAILLEHEGSIRF
ncbi:DNA/RNA non-specific endonuclease [Bosea sp. LjRoot90]|uniref:DNA/RNA non-specific endonuclease n=1 Tax=Bosea sp. LjRoot90 TaxID=3342342 RepID=UPI003ECCE8CD